MVNSTRTKLCTIYPDPSVPLSDHEASDEFQNPHENIEPNMDLRVLGPYTLCLSDGRMRSQSYILNEDGTFVNKVHFFGENSIENICKVGEEW